MSVPKFKRKDCGLEYLDNAYKLEMDIMNLCSKLSARWSRIYQQPIDKLAFLQADAVNMAYSINPINYQEYILRRTLLIFSRCCLNALEPRITSMCRVLYTNPSKCFNRKNGKNYTFSEATIMLDKKLEEIGINYSRQYDLIKGVLESDKKKYNKLCKDNLSDKEIIEIMVSQIIKMCFE